MSADKSGLLKTFRKRYLTRIMEFRKHKVPAWIIKEEQIKMILKRDTLRRAAKHPCMIARSSSKRRNLTLKHVEPILVKAGQVMIATLPNEQKERLYAAIRHFGGNPESLTNITRGTDL